MKMRFSLVELMSGVLLVNVLLHSPAWSAPLPLLPAQSLESQPKNIDIEEVIDDDRGLVSSQFYLVKEGDTLEKVYTRLGVSSKDERNSLIAKTRKLNTWLQRNSNWALIHGIYIRLALPAKNSLRSSSLAASQLKSLLKKSRLRLAVIESENGVNYEKYSVPIEDLSTTNGGDQILVSKLNRAKLQQLARLDRGARSRAYLPETTTVEKRFFIRGQARGNTNSVSSDILAQELDFETNPGLFTQLDLGLKMTERLSVMASGRASYFTAIPPDGSTLTGGVQTSPGVGAGAEYQVNPRVTLRGSVFYEQEVFLRGTSLANLELDDLYRARIALAPKILLWQRDSQKVDFEIGPTYVFSRTTNSISIRPSMIINAAVNYNIQLNATHQLGAMIYYQNQDQETDISSNRFQKLGLGLLYHWQ